MLRYWVLKDWSVHMKMYERGHYQCCKLHHLSRLMRFGWVDKQILMIGGEMDLGSWEVRSENSEISLEHRRQFVILLIIYKIWWAESNPGIYLLSHNHFKLSWLSYKEFLKVAYKIRKVQMKSKSRDLNLFPTN